MTASISCWMKTLVSRRVCVPLHRPNSMDVLQSTETQTVLVTRFISPVGFCCLHLGCMGQPVKTAADLGVHLKAFGLWSPTLWLTYTNTNPDVNI